MPTQALIIDEPWIGHIMAGRKTWEMRSRATTKRGPIALVRKGSGQIVATARITDCLPPLTAAAMADAFDRHRIPQSMIEQSGYKWFIPWVLADVQILDRPMPYRHPSGAVTWVDLAPEVRDQLAGSASGQAVATPPEPVSPRRVLETRQSPRPYDPVQPASAIQPQGGIRIPLSGGNVRNGHFSLRSATHILPADSIGGGNRTSAAKPIMVTFNPGSMVETDIAGDKMILRERGAVRAFFDRSGAAEGDAIVLRRDGDRTFSVSLDRSTD